MTLMGGPIDTRINPTAVNKLAEERGIDWFRRNVITKVPFPHPGVMRDVYPGFLQLNGFVSMNLDRHLDAHKDLFFNLVKGDGDSAQKHREFYDEYLAVMDLTAEFYLQTVETVFVQPRAAEGRDDASRRPVDPAAIRNVALLTIEGEKDDISGVGQTEAAHRLCVNIPADRKAHYLQPGVGHYGVFNGSRFRAEIAPRIADFVLSAQRPAAVRAPPAAQGRGLTAAATAQAIGSGRISTATFRRCRATSGRAWSAILSPGIRRFQAQHLVAMAKSNRTGWWLPIFLNRGASPLGEYGSISAGVMGGLSAMASRALLYRRPSEPQSIPVVFDKAIYLVRIRRHRQARRYTLRIHAATREVVLTMPPRGSLKEAKEFAQKHGGWIAARLHRLPEAAPFAHGTIVPLRGVAASHRAPRRARHGVDRNRRETASR